MATSKLDSSRAQIKQALQNGESKAAIARACSVAVTTLKDYIARDKELSAITPTTAAPAFDPEALTGSVDETELLRHEVQRLKNALKRNRKVDIELEKIQVAVAEAVDQLPMGYRPPPLLEPGNSQGTTGVLLFSDLHLGEVVDAEAMNGFNEYNTEIAKDRVEKLAESLLSHVAHSTDQMTELQIWCLGDNLSGEIHQELDVTNDYPLVEQGWIFGNLLKDFVGGLAPHFPHINVAGVVGNHPRLRKQPAAKQVHNNMDWMSYKIAEAGLENLTNVSCSFPRAGKQVVPFLGGEKNALLWHGDGVRSSMPGVPWGGIMRRVNEMGKQYAQRDILIDYYASGHVHQLNWVSQYILVNGSVKGPDEYVDKNFGGGENASQMFLTFSNRRKRITGVHPINLQD